MTTPAIGEIVVIQDIGGIAYERRNYVGTFTGEVDEVDTEDETWILADVLVFDDYDEVLTGAWSDKPLRWSVSAKNVVTDHQHRVHLATKWWTIQWEAAEAELTEAQEAERVAKARFLALDINLPGLALAKEGQTNGY